MINEQSFGLKKNGQPNCKCFCRHPELIENYDLAISDTTQTWDCHHRLESCFTQKFLREMGLYYDVEPEALIFLTQEEHSKVDSFRKRMSISRKGKALSEETKAKISKKVLCVETGEVFESTREAQRKTGVNQSNISMACNGKTYKTAGGYHWSFV